MQNPIYVYIYIYGKLRTTEEKHIFRKIRVYGKFYDLCFIVNLLSEYTPCVLIVCLKRIFSDRIYHSMYLDWVLVHEN